jgi:hypothetical protein
MSRLSKKVSPFQKGETFIPLHCQVLGERGLPTKTYFINVFVCLNVCLNVGVNVGVNDTLKSLKKQKSSFFFDYL